MAAQLSRTKIKVKIKNRPRAISTLGTGLVLLWVCAIISFWRPPISEASSASVEPDVYARAIERAARISRLRSLLISIDGELVEERYFNGTGPSKWENIKSVSKSIISTLVGIALDRGYLQNVRDPIGKYFPQYLGSADDAAKRDITIEDLLTMRAGLETTSNRNYGRWVRSSNWIRHALNRPMVEAPGGRMIYSTGNSHLLSAILTKSSGMSTFEFARRYLADPAEIPIRPWTRDPQGIFLGGNEMHLTTRGMVKFGELYVNGGRLGNKRIVSETWIEASLKPRTVSRWSGREYGYGWWIDRLAGRQSYFAWGHSGQFIFTLPDLKMVVVTTSASSSERGERREQRQAIYDLMEDYLIPAARNGGGATRSPATEPLPGPSPS
ncbi:MAG: beta-lactamase family protein [Deltaproteobacteria bacterium]|nr:beta-lactamase family protein [Deltaproteobacteria bacterium]